MNRERAQSPVIDTAPRAFIDGCEVVAMNRRSRSHSDSVAAESNAQTDRPRGGLWACELADGSIRLVFGDELSIRPPKLNRPRTVNDFFAWQRVVLDCAGDYIVDRRTVHGLTLVDAADEQTTVFVPTTELRRVTPIDAEGPANQ